MKTKNQRIAAFIGVVGITATACSSVSSLYKGDPDERWADYKSWTKITEGRTGTGDPTGFIGNVHQGRDGYRDVYVNDIGKATITGTAPYVFPAGSVVVKEQFASKADWEAQKKPGVTVSIKIADGEGSADNWIWADSYTGKAGASNFCAGCHGIAAQSDYVFTTEDFLKTQE